MASGPTPLDPRFHRLAQSVTGTNHSLCGGVDRMHHHHGYMTPFVIFPVRAECYGNRSGNLGIASLSNGDVGIYRSSPTITATLPRADTGTTVSVYPDNVFCWPFQFRATFERPCSAWPSLLGAGTPQSLTALSMSGTVADFPPHAEWQLER